MRRTGICLRTISDTFITKLKELGYKEAETHYGNECIVTVHIGDEKEYVFIDNDMFDNYNPHITWSYGRIDCGLDEEKALQILTSK